MRVSAEMGVNPGSQTSNMPDLSPSQMQNVSQSIATRIPAAPPVLQRRSLPGQIPNTLGENFFD